MKYIFHSFRVYILLFIIFASSILYAFYQHVLYIKKQRRDFIQNYHSEDEYETNFDAVRLLRSKRMHIQFLKKVKERIKKINTQQYVHNLHYGPVSTESSYVVVIQCHTNIFYLRQLINALSKASLASSAFIIFSHDHYSKEMNAIINKVTFAKYMQIFYPYSLQLYSNIFPGVEPKCLEYHCRKAPYRNAVAAQSKHFWWWQVNQIFDHIEVLRNFTDPILFLEENNYVTEDVLTVLKLLKYARDIHCPFCEVLSLGAHAPKVQQYTRRRALLAIETWSNKISSTGIAFDSYTWRNFKRHANEFCVYDDARWDKSLKNIPSRHFDGKIYLIAIDGPRVFNLDKCGNQDKRCKMQDKVNKVRKFIDLVSKKLYPLSVRTKIKSEEAYNSTGSGSFSDPRDHELCMHFVRQSVWF